jgi:WD40 repeat protein
MSVSPWNFGAIMRSAKNVDVHGGSMAEPETPEPAPEPAAERARAGVRAWVRAAGGRTRSALRSVSPYTILAFLTASAVAPLAGAGPEALTAALDQVGDVGSNFLADSLNETAKRLRKQNPQTAGWTEEQWREAIAADLLPRLAAADEQGRALHEEISKVLREVDAVGAALSEAAATDDDLRQSLEAAFRELGLGVGELGWMLAEVRQSVDGLRQQFAVQSLDLHRRLEEVRRHLVAVAREQLPSGDDVPADVPGGAVPPYPGLASFQPEDAPRFRGREAEVAELLSRLAEQAVGGPPLIITGVSGAGKSSLLRAGLLPALGAGVLGDEPASWAWVLTVPGASPLTDLLTRVQALAGSGEGRLGDLAAAATAAGRRPIIVVDQFEELFTQCADPAERLAYATALTSAAPALVVIAVRSDFYPECVALPPLAKVLTARHVVLGPLGAAAIRRAVVEPAEHAGLTVEPGLPDLLLHELGADGRDGYEPGALPLLAHALRATWDRREGIRLTVKAYRDTGGIRHAVAETAEHIYLDLPPEDRDRLRDALLALITVTGDGTAVRRRGERAASDSRVLRRLVKARLVTVGAETVEISHEALLTGWPRLAGWVAEAREDLLLRRSVIEAARDWERSGRDPDLLPRGSRLLAARERVPAGDGVPPVVGEFLAAGNAAAAREQQSRERVTRRLRRLAAGLTAALLLAVAGGLVAIDRQAEANARSRESRSRQYAAESVNALLRDDVTAVRRALQAWQEASTREARGALLSARMASLVGTLGAEPGGESVAVSPDGTRIAVGHGDGTIRLWDAATFQQAAEPMRLPQPQLVVSLAFSPDGRFLASGTFTRAGVVIWDLATGRSRHTLPAAGAVAWLPGGSTVVAGRDSEVDGQMQLGQWDATDGRLLRSVPVARYLPLDLAISADGSHVAIARSIDDPVAVWRLADGRRVTTVPAAPYLAFAPDGSLVTCDVHGLIKQYAIPSGRKLRDLNTIEESSGAGGITVTTDGVVVGHGGPTTVGMWSLTSDAVSTILLGPGSYRDAAAGPTGQLVVATSNNQPTVVLRRGVDWLRNDGKVLDVVFSPDGRRLAAASEKGQVRIWDAATRRLVSSFDAGGPPRALAYAPDGTLAVAVDRGETGDNPRTLQLRAPDGRLETTVPLSGDPRDLAISPDGALLAAPVGSGLSDLRRDGPKPSEELLVYDLRQRREIDRISLDAGSYAVAFSADGASLLAAVTHSEVGKTERAELLTWRTADLTPASAGSAPAGRHDLGPQQVLDLAPAPDGSSLAVAGTAQVVDVRTADGSRSLWSSPRQLSRIGRITFAPDSRTLAVSDMGGPVQLWDVTAGTLTATLHGHDDGVLGLAFSPDGHLLASSSGDKTTAVWRLDANDAVRELCVLAGLATRTDGVAAPRICSN